MAFCNTNCNRDLCKRHIPVVVNAIKQLANEKNRKKYIVLDFQLPATIDGGNYNMKDNKLYNLGFPRAVSPEDADEVIDVTALQDVKDDEGNNIVKNGFYITPTMRYTKIEGGKLTMHEYVALDNNGGNPKSEYQKIPVNPIPGQNMVYAKRTPGTNENGKPTSTVSDVVEKLATNIRGFMFRINIPWSMSVFYENMFEQTRKEYDKLVALMDNLTIFTDMRIYYLDENDDPKLDTIIPFKNYAASDGGSAMPLTMAGTVDTAAISILGEIYWRFYPGGIVFINHLDPNNYVNKRVRLMLAYED